jgi:heme/copper-type cytochrome/quinol oxidase subunit 3
MKKQQNSKLFGIFFYLIGPFCFGKMVRFLIDNFSVFLIPFVSIGLLFFLSLFLTWVHSFMLSKKNYSYEICFLVKAAILMGVLFIGWQLLVLDAILTTLANNYYVYIFFFLTIIPVFFGIFVLVVYLYRFYFGYWRDEQFSSFEIVLWYWHVVDVFCLFFYLFFCFSKFF